MRESERKYPCRLGVRCDGCGTTWEGDFVVSDEVTHPQRVALVTEYVKTYEGWRCLSVDETYCPRCGQLTRDALEKRDALHAWLDDQPLYRDPERFKDDPVYYRAIRAIEWGREEYREYPVTLEEHRVHLVWVHAESPTDAYEFAKDNPIEVHSLVGDTAPFDSWLDVSDDLDDPTSYAGSVDSFVYPTSLAERMGPVLPNGGRNWNQEIRTSWWLAHHENEQREKGRR